MCVFAEWGSEITPAINGDFVSQARQFLSNLLVIGFDAAVLRDHAPAPDEGDANASSGEGAARRRESSESSWRREAGVDFQQGIHVLGRIVLFPQAAAGAGAHFLRQIVAIEKKSDGVGELFAISCG